MKNIITAFAMLATMSFSANAIELNEYKVFRRLNNLSTQKSLVRYLQTSNEQTEILKEVFALTDEKISHALENENEIAAEKAMWFNLANAKYILTAEQYKKYLIAINLTLHGKNDEILAEK